MIDQYHINLHQCLREYKQELFSNSSYKSISTYCRKHNTVACIARDNSCLLYCSIQQELCFLAYVILVEETCK